MSKKKIVIGLSGGVDSSVAAALLKDEGYEVIGVTMITNPVEVDRELSRRGISTAAEDAKRVADSLGIEHRTVDFRSVFSEKVIDYFVDEYMNGRTPNPCVICNRFVKWEALLSYAESIGADAIATGHYARIGLNDRNRMVILSAISAAKDQTYALYNLTQDQLKRTIMPVGAYSKEEIRSIAAQKGIPVADKPDSQEICFIPDQDYAGFIRRRIGDRVPGPGNFVAIDGTYLGQHKGITHYTVGQRKGLGLSMGHPVFVTEIDPLRNEVVIGENEDVFSDGLICSHVNLMGLDTIREGDRFLGKIRYSHKGEFCTVHPLENGLLEIRFEKPVRAVTPGQAVVLYEEDTIALGGIIEKRLRNNPT